MITSQTEYEKAQKELLDLTQRLDRLQQSHPGTPPGTPGSKGFTKAGVRKLIARLHEELAVYEGTAEFDRPNAR